MEIDLGRVREVLAGRHTYYGAGAAPVENDARLNPGSGDFIGTQLTPDTRVLDVGCGSGATLLRHSARFRAGVGVDSDPAHIEMALAAREAAGAANVEFALLDFLGQGGQLADESFDLVFSQRGPVGGSAAGIREARRVLRPGGLLFFEEIGEVHHREAGALFAQSRRPLALTTVRQQAVADLEAQGFEVRIAADLISKRSYPDVYAWLQFQCAIWSWQGRPLPEPDDPRIALFAEQNRTASGWIETTHHVVWAGGVRR